MFDRIEPFSFFLWDMLRDDVAELFDQRELPVLRIEIGIEGEFGQFRFLRQREQESSCRALEIGLKGETESNLPLNRKTRLQRELFEPGEQRVERRRKRNVQAGGCFTRELHEFLP